MNREQLKQKYPTKEFGEINVEREYQAPLTGEKNEWGNEKRDYSDDAQVIDGGWNFYLDHSCDEWVIGGIENAEKFSKDLIEAIEYTKSNP
jgi:hypothetical protein